MKSVSFVSNVTAGGGGFTATLTITAVGNLIKFVIDWGDGTSNTTTASTNPNTRI